MLWEPGSLPEDWICFDLDFGEVLVHAFPNARIARKPHLEAIETS
jgi:hypothetical protein